MNEASCRLGRILSELRHKKGMSQELFADFAGVHRTYVSQVERGLKSPTVSVLTRFSNVLEISLSELFAMFERDQ